MSQAKPIKIPDKKYFTIGEVAQLCTVKAHVLRYWEQAFVQLEPNKRRGRRYYQHKDIKLIMEIKSLLHEQGFTILGAKDKLDKLEGKQLVIKELSVENTEHCINDKIYLQLIRMQTENKEFLEYITNKY